MLQALGGLGIALPGMLLRLCLGTRGNLTSCIALARVLKIEEAALQALGCPAGHAAALMFGNAGLADRLYRPRRDTEDKGGGPAGAGLPGHCPTGHTAGPRGPGRHGRGPAVLRACPAKDARPAQSQ